MGKVGKVAQREKVVPAKTKCPYCEVGTVIPVLYYPPKGRPINARGCEKCKHVWGRGVVLAAGVKLGI